MLKLKAKRKTSIKLSLPRNLLSVSFLAIIFMLTVAGLPLKAQSLNIPAKTWGLSFGNSRNFAGLRFNFRDRNVEKIYGINITLWKPY